MSTVNCPGCGHANPIGQKFCGECASPLPLLCPSCGAMAAPSQKFCGECASPLQTGSSADTSAPTQTLPAPSRPVSTAVPAPATQTPNEERRLVSALFCDLVGFTPLSAQLDPEDIRDIQSEYFTAMSAQIEHYGGTVEKYAGDAVLALFGAPVAHEDDAERAVLCALGMQGAIELVARKARERWDVEPSIRVGVNTGDVVSGIWDAGGRQDVAVTGDAVNTAARLQAAAESGEVLVGEETMRLTRRRIKYGEKRELTLRGKMGTVPAYSALGVRDQLGERWEEAPKVSPLVGRDREMVRLLDAWMRAQAGEGQLVTVVGDAGVGKSRLVAELVEKISSSAAIRIIRGRCLSYGQEISLWLLADLLRSLFGLSEQDTLDEVRPKVQVGVASTLEKMDTGVRTEAVDVLGEVLGLPPGESMVGKAGAEIRRQALIRSLRLLFGALSERAPTMVVLEDLHWIDQASQDVLKEALSDVPGLRLLVVTAQRPGWIAPWSDWGWTERITVRPLREEDAALLAGAVLGGTRLSTELELYIQERAAGNPFFVEEMLRALEETGGLEERDGQMHLVAGAAEKLPSTLTEVLLARLDRLDLPVRNVAQVASVIGRTFAVQLLARVVGREPVALEMPLTALQQAEIAFPRAGSELEYVFKHVSMREAAYNTLVQKRRQELHLATARAIARLYPSDEYVEMIAHHYARTDEREEAVEWLEKAGDRAAAIYAVESALLHYREAAKRVRENEGDILAIARLDEKLGSVLHVAGRYDEAIPVLERAIAAYREARDLEAAGRATAILGMNHRRRGTPEEGISQVQPMVDLLQSSGPSSALASLYVALSHLFLLLGRYREQLEVAEKAGEIARALGDDRLLGEAEMRRGTALMSLGRPEEGLQIMAGALPLVEAGGDLVTLYITLNNVGSAAERLGRTEQMRQYNERALAVTERIGNPANICFVLGNIGATLLTLGDWQGAREALERGVALTRTMGRSADAANPLNYLGNLLLWEGDWAAAARYMNESLALAQETGDRQLQEGAQVFLAELDVLEGRPEKAVARLEPWAAQEDADMLLLPTLAWAYLSMDDDEGIRRAEEVARQAVAQAQGQPGLMVDAVRVQGMVLMRRGQLEEAERVLTEGLELARTLPHPYAEGRILFQLGLLHARKHDAEAESTSALQEALAIFQRLGAKKDIERTEQAILELAQSPTPKP